MFSFTRRFHTFLKIHGAFWVGEGEMAQRLTNLSNKSVKLASEEFASTALSASSFHLFTSPLSTIYSHDQTKVSSDKTLTVHRSPAFSNYEHESLYSARSLVV